MSLVGISSVLLGWSTAQRTAVLIDQDAALVGILTKEGRALSKERRAGFIAEVWGQNDGLLLSRDEAFGLWQSGNMTVKHHWSKKITLDQCIAHQRKFTLHDFATRFPETALFLTKPT